MHARAEGRAGAGDRDASVGRPHDLEEADRVGVLAARGRGLVYVGSWDHRLYALGLGTGKIVWSVLLDGEVDSSAAFANGTVYVGDQSGTLTALNARTGAIRWKAQSFSHFRTGREYFYATPTVAYGRVFASNTDGTVYAFGATTGHLLWASHVGTYVYTAPAVWDKKVYVGTYDGKFLALDAATGDTVWSREMPSAVHGAPTVMSGLVYLSTPQVHSLGGRAVFLLPLFHPAAGLRTPAVKETLRGDFETLPKLLAGPDPGAPDPEEEIEEAPVPGPPQPPADQLDFFG